MSPKEPRSREGRRRADSPKRGTPAPLFSDAMLAHRAWWVGAFGFALLVLLWTMRGFSLGVPVADDYSFLARLVFQKPLDLFDSMGAVYYWRPLSRQVYFSLVGPFLGHAPWVAGGANLLMLLVTAAAVGSMLRRAFPAAIAATIAALPLVSEPVRTLIAWPSGAQHLLAGMFVAIALHERLAKRRATALAALAAALLSHESGAFGALALIVVALIEVERASEAERPRARREAALDIGAVLAMLAAWLAAYAIARRHGVALPSGGVGMFESFAAVCALAFPSWLNLEDVNSEWRIAVLVAQAALILIALASLVRAPVRTRRVAMLVLGGSFAAFALGIAPLARLLPDWNAWRAWVPSLVATVGFASGLVLLDRRLLFGFAALRCLSLLLATPALEVVEYRAPETTSQMSYVRLVRLQRIVESTRATMLSIVPTLPPHGDVRFWRIPWLTEVGFQGPSAMRVWYRDSTLSWRAFGGYHGQRVDALVEFRERTNDPAQAVEPESLREYMRACAETVAGSFDLADSSFARAAASTRTRCSLWGLSMFNRAKILASRRQLDGAEALIAEAWKADMAFDDELYALSAHISFLNDRPNEGFAALEKCLRLNPENETGRMVLDRLRGAGVIGPGPWPPTRLSGPLAEPRREFP